MYFCILETQGIEPVIYALQAHYSTVELSPQMVPLERFELPINAFVERRLSRLGYRGHWWEVRRSNPRLGFFRAVLLRLS
jgi:hypothetical protein